MNKWMLLKMDITKDYITKQKFLRWDEGDILFAKQIDEDNFILCDTDMILNKQIMYADMDDLFNYFNSVSGNSDNDYLHNAVSELLDKLTENATIIE